MHKIDAIVALGGGISREGHLSASSRRRIDLAVTLHKQGLADRIITSGRWSHRLHESPPTTEAAGMKRRAIQQGVAEAAIFSEEDSQDTIGNAYFIKQNILLPLGWRRLTVVTCPAHAARAQLIFEHVCGDGYDITTQPTQEPSSISHRFKEALGIIALTQELAAIPPGDDQKLQEYYNYLTAVPAA